MNCSVESYRNFDNELCVDLVDNNCGLPHCFWLSAHLSEYRTFRTARTYAYQAKYYFEYFTSKKIDIVNRVESGKLFNKNELEQYMNHCLYKANKLVDSPKTVVEISQFSSKTLDNLIYATRATKARVSNNTTKLRIKAFIKFITFLYDQIHAGFKVPNAVHIRYKDIKDRVKKYLDKLVPTNEVVKDEFEQAIPTDIYFRLNEITKPYSQDNPWSQHTRLRNHLIVQIFNETGIRIGALCKLKISDLMTNNPTRIRITRTPNDPSDPRAQPAAQKTKRHSSAISKELMQSLLHYIETDRAKHDASKNHDFVFVSDKGSTAGQPISIQGVQYIFEKLSEPLKFKVHPHLTRHKFQEIFEDAAIKRGLAAERIEELRKYACGWSENSKMASIYNEHKIATESMKVSRQAQNAILGGMEELS